MNVIDQMNVKDQLNVVDQTNLYKFKCPAFCINVIIVKIIIYIL